MAEANKQINDYDRIMEMDNRMGEPPKISFSVF